MAQKGENIIAVVVLLLIVINLVGLGIPVWYNKYHQHNVLNETKPETNCVIHVYIQEGLWQRYCLQSHMEDNHCELDVQEWCDNLDFPEYNTYVVAIEIVGDLILVFVVGTIFRNKCRHTTFNIEMLGAEIGAGGILMMVGVLVYAAADSEIGYQATDLHVGWALCAGAGGVCILLCIICMYRHMKSIPRVPVGYFPINDEDVDDVTLIDL